MIRIRLLIYCSLLTTTWIEAQTVTNVIDRFDPAGVGNNIYSSGQITNVWANWFGNAFQSLSWDSSMDANTNAASGSLKIIANFPGTGSIPSQFEVFNGFSGINPALNALQFTNFQCDVRFAAGSATNGGNYGFLQFGTPTPGYGQDYFGGVTIAVSNTNWVHVSLALNANTDTNLLNISGILIHIYNPSLSGQSTLWVDNLQFVGMATNPGKVTINYTNTQQRIDGFGASSAWYFSPLSTSDADLLFSTNIGVGLSLLRTRIAPGGVIDDSEGTIAQEALARGARVWSTPWSPPGNFKDTNTVNGGSFVSSTGNYQGYASELANYVATMKNTYGVNLYAVSVQNEPDYSTTYESCLWTGQQIHDFIPYLSTALTASNVASTQIMLPEDANWKWDLATNTMADNTTSNLVGVLAAHNYGSSASAVMQFGTPCPKTLWETEHYIDTDDSITNGLLVAQEIHSFLTVAQANAYHYWWLTGSGTGSIADNTANPAKRLFAMGNYSRFIRPNFYRVGVTNTATALVTAFKDPASSNFVIVAANNSAFPVNQTFTLTNFPVAGPLRQWVTSATEPLANHGGAITVTDGTFATVLPAWSVTTYVYQQPVTNPPSILQQPSNQIALPGDTVTFSVQATGGTAPLYYQWLFNGTNHLAAATNASVTLTSAALTNAGNYSVIITNYAGSATSSVASLSFITITWGAPVTISGAADISTNGTSLYAYNNSGSSAAVNTVTFAGVNSFTAWGSGVTLGLGWSATTTSAFSGGSSPPWTNLPASYQTILQGGAWNNGGTATVTLNNLIVGHQYQVQVWVDDSRPGSTTNRTETLPGVSDSTVTLAYNRTYAAGGVGQYTIGTFTATATNQVFTMNGNASTQLNALQVRDVTPIAVAVSVMPAATNLVYGHKFVLAANVIGTGPIAYQWFDNRTNPVPGATYSFFSNTPAVAGSGNYTVLVTNAFSRATNLATVAVGPALLTVTANNTNRPYGSTSPVFTASYSGFVNGDNFSSTVTGSPALSTPATSGSGAGSYPIVATNGTLAAANYTFIFVNGNLTITPASYPTNITSSVSGAMLTLTWPPSHLGWTLQAQTNSLTAGLGTNWVDVANSATTNQMGFPLMPTNGSVFFRLRH